MEFSGTTDASLMEADCAEGTRALTTTSATASATIERDIFFSG
jgi:hypothetical protein